MTVPINNDKAHIYGLLALFMALCSIVLTVLFSNLDGSITKELLINFVGATITSLALSITLVLAVLAINAFGNYREIAQTRVEFSTLRNKLENESEDFQNELRRKVKNTDLFFLIISSLIATVVSANRNNIENSDEQKIFSLLFHGEMFVNLMKSTSAEEQINICRQIVGSMDGNGSLDILDSVIEKLQSIRKDGRSDRIIIDAILRRGYELIAEIRVNNSNRSIS